VSSRRDVTGMMIRIGKSSPDGRMITAIFRLLNCNSARYMYIYIYINGSNMDSDIYG
jgi:hypothetical protein